MKDCVLIINPGSTSTKLGFVDGEGKLIWEATLKHEGEGAARMRDLVDVRAAQIAELLDQMEAPLTPKAVVGRGGPLRPLQSGVYLVNETMIEELLSEKWSSHPSNLGAPLAKRFAALWNVPAYIVDPVTVDDFVDVARISGVPEIARKSRSHALNIRSCAFLAANEIGKPLPETRFVIAHLGGGISVAAVEGGRITDVNDALLGMGPFSPERAGATPLEGVVDLATSGKYSVKELKAYLSKSCGLKGYLATNDFREVEARVAAGDEKADLIYRAMIYQIAKEIGAYAAALKGKLDALIVTGGLANSQKLIAQLKEYVGWLGRMIVYPGERELEAMGQGAFRVLRGQELPKEY
ncbi:MAG: butyrate kinase [bacterium]|nr:butyrate kinase [bacterium]